MIIKSTNVGYGTIVVSNPMGAAGYCCSALYGMHPMDWF